MFSRLFSALVLVFLISFGIWSQNQPKPDPLKQLQLKFSVLQSESKVVHDELDALDGVPDGKVRFFSLRAEERKVFAQKRLELRKIQRSIFQIENKIDDYGL